MTLGAYCHFEHERVRGAFLGASTVRGRPGPRRFEPSYFAATN